MEASVATTPISIVFVDDDPAFLSAVTKITEKAVLPMSSEARIPVRQQTVTNPSECLRWVRKHRVDAVFADLVMPQEDGVSLLEQVHQVDPGVRLLLLTGHKVTIEQEERLHRIGAILVRKDTPAFARTVRLVFEQILSATLAATLLVERLEKVEDKDAVMMTMDESLTVPQLINEIRLRTPRGMEHVQLWLDAQQTARNRRNRK